MSPRLWHHRIGDILTAIQKILRYTAQMDFETFSHDLRTIDAVIRNFIVIGEAARNIPVEVTLRHPELPWRLMADMRNFAVHEYWGVELSTIWRTIEVDLPPLIPLLEKILPPEEG